MRILSFFSPSDDDAWDEFLDSLPDFDEVDAQTLHEYKEKVETMIAQLDACEPKNQNSDAYDDWADKHEDLEDVLDEILDCLEAL